MKSLRLIFSNPRYLAPALVFSSLNIWFGVWAIYIPSVKEKLRLDKAELGIALFFLSLGVFIVFPFASKIIDHLRVGRATWFAIVISSISALLPLLAPNYTLLCASLLVFGITQGLTDISMNTLVSEIEKKDGLNIMSAAHGFFSLGGILVGMTSFLILLIGNPFLHMLLMVILVLVVNFFIRKQYLHIEAPPTEKQPFNAKLFKPLLLLGIVGFISMGSEGAIVDWSGIYLKEVTFAPETLYGAGFLAFSTTMTLGRFLGDGLSQRLGSISVLALGAVITVFGFCSVLLATTLFAIFGFLLTGLGLSVLVPELFRIGGKVEGVDTAQGVAFIAGMGYAGFLSGPVILGYVAEQFSLGTSFAVLLGCAIFVLVLAFFLKQKQ